MKHIKYLSLILAATLLLVSLLPVNKSYALTSGQQSVDSSGTAVIDIPVTLSAAVFSVTVPTSLPVQINGYGQVVTATDAIIKNNSVGVVYISNVEINSLNNWKLAKYDKVAADNSDVNTKTVGWQMTINGQTLKTSKSGTSETLVTNTLPYSGPLLMAGGVSLPISYNATIPPQSNPTSGSLSIANVVITVSWKEVPITYINFQIDGVTYTAVDGMSWFEWIDSKYNTDGYGVWATADTTRPYIGKYRSGGATQNCQANSSINHAYTVFGQGATIKAVYDIGYTDAKSNGGLITANNNYTTYIVQDKAPVM